MRNNKGFTLIELLIVISIGSILITASFGLFSVGRESHSIVVEEFDKQSSIRHSAEVINESIKYATVGFVVTEDNYKPENGLENGLVESWNYIGLNGTKEALVHYKWVEDSSEHETEILAQAPENVTFDLTFHRSAKHPDSNLLKYYLKGVKNGKDFFDFETELEALNALQVIDWGNVKDRAVALAYRTEETPEIDEIPIGALSLVIDESGSMDWSMEGNYSYTDIDESDPQRIALLRHTLNKDGGLFTILADSEAYTSIVSFASNANNPGGFYKVEDNIDSLKEDINNLNPNGGTNTGDGIRRGYYNLVDFSDTPPNEIGANQVINNYLVLLVDGQTNTLSIEEWNWNTDYFLDSGNTPFSSGSFNNLSAQGYVQEVGNLIDNSNSIEIKKSFVIGYSKDSGNISNIVSSLNIPVSPNDEDEDYINNDQVFIATDQDSLTEAFEDIGNYIKEDLWQVSGPKLN